MSLGDLPALNAALNSLSFVFLTLGFIAIRRRRTAGHKQFMLAAVTTSALFLVSYLTYHFAKGVVTTFPRERYPDFAKGYYALLISHTILAVAVLPLVILTLRHAFKNRLDRHKRLARVTLPIWAYVSITGVLVYFILYHWCR